MYSRAFSGYIAARGPGYEWAINAKAKLNEMETILGQSELYDNVSGSATSDTGAT